MFNYISIILANLNISGYWLLFFGGFFILVYLLKILVLRFGQSALRVFVSLAKSLAAALTTNEDVQRFLARYPRITIFLERRLDKTHFAGLPLTMFSLAFFYTLFLFGGVVEGVARSSSMVFVDTRVANLLLIFRNEVLTTFFTKATVLGGQLMILFLIGVVTVLLWLWRKRYYLIPFYVTLLGSEGLTYLGKIFFRRPRPELAIYLENSYSFPSGHATTAVAFYGFVTYLLMTQAKKRKTKINFFFIGFIVISLIDFSRLYLGVHYLSDVWGGDLVGLLWLIIGISLAEWSRLKIGKGPELLSLTRKKRLTWFLVLGSGLFYILVAYYYQPELKIAEIPSEEKTVKKIEEIFSQPDLKYTETLLGARQEPLSFVIVAPDDGELIDMFERAGWSLADSINLHSAFKAAKTALMKRAYQTAPITPYFWNLQVHNFGFEKSTQSNNIRQRHHARFWRTNYEAITGQHIYVGTTSLDNGIKWGLVHRISPDIDTERDYLLADLRRANPNLKFTEQQLVAPVLGQNIFGDQFFSDGRAYFGQ